MDWIKRNLYFVIGGAVALILMGLAGYYLYAKWQRDAEVMGKLDQDFAELQRLNNENPHPGSGSVDNVAEAQAQQQQIRAINAKLRKFYQPIPPIPEPTAGKVSDRDFSSALSRTIDQLQRAASSASVTLPPAYSFSFEAQSKRVTFAPGSTILLATQLGEVKTICDVLIAAKVNSIDGIRRERVSADDLTGPLTDYLDLKSTTNDLAVLTPYEVSFRCFSSELAGVLSGFAGLSNCVLVQSVNVEPASGTNVVDATMSGGLPGYPSYGIPPATMDRYGTPPPPPAAMDRYGAPPATMDRYSAAAAGATAVPGAGVPSSGGVAYRGLTAQGGYAPRERQAMAPPVVAARPGVAPTAGRSAGLPTVLDEKPLKVTLNLVVVKLAKAASRQ